MINFEKLKISAFCQSYVKDHEKISLIIRLIM